MAPISVLPGRLRVQSRELVGRERLCRHLEGRLLQIGGVLQAEASHRTGRLLVIYRIERIDRDPLIDEIKRMIQALQPLPEGSLVSLEENHRVPFSEERFGGLARDLALIGIKALFPKPWNTVLPVAMNLVERIGR